MLTKNKKLEYLDMHDCTGDDTMRLIAEGLQHNDTFKHLNAGMCNLTVEGTYIYYNS